jgi:6-phosphogluconolactonase
MGPIGIAVHSSGRFLCVALLTTQSVSVVAGFTIESTTGALASIAGSPFTNGSFWQGTPAAAMVGVAISGDFLYVTNPAYPSQSISAFAINPSTGALSQISGSPFPNGGHSSLALAVDPLHGGYLYAANWARRDGL